MNEHRQAPDPVATAEPDLSGRQLGDFRLLRRLGRGAMAEVYLAEQCQLKRRVAVKVLKPALALDQTYLQRFQREAQAAASLIHTNIVQIYEVGQVGGLHFIAQEYVQGQNLGDWINRRGPADLPHALSVMRQVAAALAKAAEQGVVHRDIKPENIMLTPSGEVKVTDFGLARVAREGEGTDLTQVGITLGTPLYMSPEQVEGRPLDPRSDLYSFGVTCYQMLTGSPPFRAETALGVAVQHLKTAPEPLEDLRPDLPPGLARLVHRMLAKDPDQRCSSARDVLRELRRLYQEYATDQWPEDLPGWEASTVETAVDQQVETTRQLDTLMKAVASSARSDRRKSILIAAGAVVAFLLGGTVAWLTTQDNSLLANAESPKPSVPQQQTALQQYLDASRIGTEEAWRSVILYFPDREYFVGRAKQQLARIYLRQGADDRAVAIFDELADPGEPDESLRAFGLAGKCIVLSIRGRYQESAAVLEQLWPIRSRLQDGQMRDFLDYVIRRNQTELGTRMPPQWEEWRQEQSAQGG